MNRKLLLTGLGALAAVAVAAAAYFAFRDAAPDAGKLALTPWDRTLGASDAPVQIVEYAAPSCPICAYWDKTVFPDFRKAYVDTGKVHYVLRVFPLQPVDLAVDAMARCLPESRYFGFIDMMFRNQSDWDPDGHDIPDVQAALYRMGDKAGMTAVEVQGCTTDRAQLAKIAAVGQHAAETFHIDSTPSFLVDGEFHQRDMMKPDGMRAVLDAALKRKGR